MKTTFTHPIYFRTAGKPSLTDKGFGVLDDVLTITERDNLGVDVRDRRIQIVFNLSDKELRAFIRHNIG